MEGELTVGRLAKESLVLLRSFDETKNFILLANKRHPHLSTAVNITFVFHQIFIVFNSSVIQITLVCSRQLCYRMEVITDAVRFQVALHHAEILVEYFNSSNRVILQPVARFRKTGKLQITAVTW